MHTKKNIYIYIQHIIIYHLYTSTNHQFRSNESSASAKANIPRRRPSSWAAAWPGFRPSAPPKPWAPWCAPGTCATSATRHRTGGTGWEIWNSIRKSWGCWGIEGYNNPFILILTPPNNKHGRSFLVFGGFLVLGKPNTKLKPLILKTSFSDLKIN